MAPNTKICHYSKQTRPRATLKSKGLFTNQNSMKNMALRGGMAMKRLPFIVAIFSVLLLATSSSHAAIYRLTDNAINDFYPAVYHGTIAWAQWDGNDTEIYYWDGTTVIQLTDNSTSDILPALYDGTIAWQGGEATDTEIYFWDGTDIIRVSTDDTTENTSPALYDGTIAWSARDASKNFQIYYWDGTTITQVTTSPFGGQTDPSLYDATIAWTGYNGTRYEIYYWDGVTTEKISDNTTSTLIGIPSLYNRTIAWDQSDGSDYEIYYWDGTTIIQVTDNNWQDGPPSLYHGTIAWACTDGVGSDTEVFFWDGTTIIQVTGNNTNDQSISLNHGTIAWAGFDGTDWEIYQTVPFPATIFPENHDFGIIALGAVSTQSFTVANVSDFNLDIEVLSVTGPNAAEFLIQNDTCSGTSLDPSEPCTCEVVFVPGSLGSKLAFLDVHDPNILPLQAPLTGLVTEICECDLNGDGACNEADWTIFGEDWGRTDCNQADAGPCECDLNHDGKCDMQDWLLFGQDWGRIDCPTSLE
jgi:hypothetical protein